MNLALLLPLLISAAQGPAESVAQKPVDYQRQVRPILAKRCLACHGGDESTREADLQLQLRDNATLLRDDEYQVIVPGDAEASELIFRVQDDLDPMPPKKTGHRLTADEIEILKRWIEEGAEYSPHWAFQKPQQATPPALPVGMRGQGVGAIDAFIYERLAQEGLSPSPRADRRTLIRRLSLDLIGLPPTSEEVDAFVKDLAPGAYERLVARLMASAHFGVRWAGVWLDLARSADSKGLGSDPLRSIYRYRDWVIEAINADMPFDQFTMQQMAGDLLPDATTEQKLATAFHRNSLVNTEGGTDDEEFRVAAVKDRINLSMQVWMGLTFGCAECHTHKFDPITHEDYYSTFAIFNQTADADKNDDSPKIPTPTANEQRQLRELHKQQQALRERIAETAIDEKAFYHWRVAERKAQQAWIPWRPSLSGRRNLVSTASYQLSPQGTALLQGEVPEKDNIRLSMMFSQETPTALRVVAMTDPSLPRRGPGASPENGNFVLSEVNLVWHPMDGQALSTAPNHAEDSSIHAPLGRYIRIRLPGEKRILSLAEVEVHSSGKNVATEGTAKQSSVSHGGMAERAIDGQTDGNYFGDSVTHTETESDPWWELDLGSPIAVERVRVWNRTDGNQQPRLNGAVMELLDENRQLVSTHYLREAPLESADWWCGKPSELYVSRVMASFEQTDFTAAMAVDGNSQTGWAIAPRQGREHELHLHFDCPQGGGMLELNLEQNYGSQHVLGHFGISWTDLPEPPAILPKKLKQALLNDRGIGLAQSVQAKKELELMRDHFRELDPGIQGLRQKLKDSEDAVERLAVAKTPVLVALPANRQRKTHVLDMGNFLLPKQEVSAAIPAAFKWGDGAVLDRRQFAAWLTHADNPLTPRVQVNRIWARLFGRGLVSTEEDFGAQGALPSHELLLDWLAVDYSSHWSLKRFLKTLVTSSTYRQSSRTLQHHLDKDPANILLSRGPRFRLPAETVRDQALSVSGLLSSKIGGPSVFPPQPEGLWQAAFNGERDWKTSEGEDRWRRGVYTFLRRSTPYPSMVVFDAPSREICTIRRIRTNTPLQAFVTLNDPVFVECAQALSRRILAFELRNTLADRVHSSAARSEDVARLRQAYLWCMARPASEEVIEVLLELLTEQRTHYQSQDAAALAMATDPLGPLPSGANAVEHAAWTVVANVLLNMDEFLNKN